MEKKTLLEAKIYDELFVYVYDDCVEKAHRSFDGNALVHVEYSSHTFAEIHAEHQHDDSFSEVIQFMKDNNLW